MFKKCVIDTCDTVKDGDGLTLHRLPKNAEMQQEWLRIISNETGQTVFHEDDVICSKHFSPESFSTSGRRKILNAKAIPFEVVIDEPISKRIKVESVTDDEGTYCHVTTCINVASDTATLSSSIVYHPFPTDKNLAKQWKEFCGKTDENFVNCFVCSEHFTSDDYMTDSNGENMLKSTAVPSVDKININEVIEDDIDYEDENENEEESREDDGSGNEVLEEDKAVYSLEKCSTPIESTTSKMTNRRQYEVMITFMEKHQSIAQGTAKNPDEKSKNQRLWERLAYHVNVHGPPTKTADGWKRVWRDFKYNVKNKLIRNKKIMDAKNTAGTLNKWATFSSVEERVIKLCAMRSMIEGVSKVKAFGKKSITAENNPESSSTKTEKKIDNSYKLPDVIIEKVPMPSATAKSNACEQTNEDNKSSRNYLDEDEDSLDSTAIELLQKQMKLQEWYFKEIADNMKLIAEILKEQCKTMTEGIELKEKQFELEKKDFEEKQKYRREKLRIMQEELNVRRASLELRLRTRVNGEE